MSADYKEEHIKSLTWFEHVRVRPGMYIGKIGNGSSRDDGIYVLLKETIDNAIDEFLMAKYSKIEILINDNLVSVRDYGRGIPLGKVVDVVSKINTGAKYDSVAFKKTVGLNGVGAKAVNALSKYYRVVSYRDNQAVEAIFSKGVLQSTEKFNSDEPNGTLVQFIPDDEIFEQYEFRDDFIEEMLWNYVCLNKKLKIIYNGKEFFSENGLIDLLKKRISSEIMFDIIHLEDKDFEFAFTYASGDTNEEIFSYVNGQYTVQGGTHVQAFREAFVDTIRNFYNKNYDSSDIRVGLLATISIRIHEPVFESQTKTKLGSSIMEPNGRSIKSYIVEVLRKHLDNELHRNPDIAKAIQEKILINEKQRKDINNLNKLSREVLKKASLHNKKLRDCKIHFNTNHERRLETSIFITEGDSASGSITKARDANIQAVFSLKGKPLNVHKAAKKSIFTNEEFSLLIAALNIENGLDNLRYNNVIIATDADEDGKHIRLLLLTFFLKFYPDLIKAGHLYVLQTPLFRVRNKHKTIYCYSESEKTKALNQLGSSSEITRFKGLGEISPDEFRQLIGKNIRLEPIVYNPEIKIEQLLDFYMGENTASRSEFVIENLRYNEILDLL